MQEKVISKYLQDWENESVSNSDNIPLWRKRQILQIVIENAKKTGFDDVVKSFKTLLQLQNIVIKPFSQFSKDSLRKLDVLKSEKDIKGCRLTFFNKEQNKKSSIIAFDDNIPFQDAVVFNLLEYASIALNNTADDEYTQSENIYFLSQLVGLIIYQLREEKEGGLY